MLFASILIGFKNLKKGERKQESLQKHEVTYNKLLGIGISIVVGFISSIFGIGGGIIHVPALIYLMGFPTHLATATSHCILAVSTTVGVLAHYFDGHIVFNIAVPVSIGAIFGAQLGAFLAKKLRAKAILLFMSLGILVLGLKLIVTSRFLF